MVQFSRTMNGQLGPATISRHSACPYVRVTLSWDGGAAKPVTEPWSSTAPVDGGGKGGNCRPFFLCCLGRGRPVWWEEGSKVGAKIEWNACLFTCLLDQRRTASTVGAEGRTSTPQKKKTKSVAKEIVQSKRLLRSVTFHFRFGLKFGLAVLKIIVPACVVFPSLPGMHVLAQLCCTTSCKTAADSNSANAQRYDEIVLVGIVHVWTRKRASPVREHIQPTISLHCIVLILCWYG